MIQAALEVDEPSSSSEELEVATLVKATAHSTWLIELLPKPGASTTSRMEAQSLVAIHPNDIGRKVTFRRLQDTHRNPVIVGLLPVPQLVAPPIPSRPPRPKSHRWIKRSGLVIAGLALVIGAREIYRSLTSTPPKSKVLTVAPSAPGPTGSLTLESIPQGAIIYLDGKTLTLQNGARAKTPADLHNLKYGQSYELRLIKSGYRPYAEVVAMGESTDRNTIRPKLVPHDGGLIIEVHGDDADHVSVSVNEKPVGHGPLLNLTFPGHQTVSLAATARQKRCSFQPSSRLRIEPNMTKSVTVRCR